QEALTNTRKHAGPTRATVRLTYGPDLLTVHVRDHGPGPGSGSGFARSSTTEPSGHGLIGMRERAALHGGTLTATPHPDGGFAVHAELPLPAEESTAEAAELPSPIGEFATRPTEPACPALEFAALPVEARR
ncbi:MAG: hypothetical protein LBV78_12930, partial [Kitasatospora sp.]|nr:hypothetical protein [Kitasatospora sp.]